MKTMSEENKENPSVKNREPISDLLMKPFSLGWTREVVRRVVTHCGTPNCDIYYFSPNKKKFRSLIEVKSNLTDGLSDKCFSFKREPLGLSPDLETVRDAKVRGKGAKADKSTKAEKPKEKRKAPENGKKVDSPENADEDVTDGGKKAKKRKTETEEVEESKPDTEAIENKEEKPETNNTEGKIVETESKESVAKQRRTKSEGKDAEESRTFSSRTRAKANPAKPTTPARLQTVKSRKSALKRVINAKQTKQAKVVPSRKTLKSITKKVASPKRKLPKPQNEKKAGLKSKKPSSKVKTVKKPVAKTKSEVTKAPETNNTEKKLTAKDLKSIVKKNIGKYREMREKQKLGAVKNQARSPTKKIAIYNIPRSRSEPISKNKPFYLKPLEKGWRRELVYRTNCAKAGQQADVYYFHPNGKKLRSCREVAENLTHGLSIECFTFRKEPLGCGEPSEVIRNARSVQKN